MFRVFFTICFLVSSSVFAFGRGRSGGWSLGVNAGIINASQEDMNTLIARANSREGGISTSKLGNAWELAGFISYRLKGSSLAWQLRPSYFLQAEKGQNSQGMNFNYAVNGFTVFPVLRWNMLEDKTIKFYSQFGVGWAFISGSIEEDGNTDGQTARVDFNGNDMGYMAGLGAEFCFFGGSHCFNIEGNLRFLSVERLVASSHSGTFDTNPSAPSLSQPSGSSPASQEVELDSNDVGVSLSGVQGFVGYIFHF